MSEKPSNPGTEILLPEGTTGRRLRDLQHYATAVRVGDHVQLSGVTGIRADSSIPDTIDAEVDTAFDNIAGVLDAAGLGWSNVIGVRSYHLVAPGVAVIPDESIDAVNQRIIDRMPDHYATWTAVGVAALAIAGMNVEIEITAHA